MRACVLVCVRAQDIPKPYGYPVRCIVPGHAGARNCKDLEKVPVTDQPALRTGTWEQCAVPAAGGPVVMAGYGYGLPRSRLYARYFGGDLQVISMDGYGTDVYLHLNRLGHVQ